MLFRTLNGALLSLLLLLATVLNTAGQAPAAEKASAVTYIFVRHAEKSGTEGDVPLSAKGKTRADELAGTLAHSGVTHIFTSELIRTRETAAPLAKQLGLAAKIVPARDRAGLLDQLTNLPDKSVALVVSHSNIISELIEKFGAKPRSPVAEDEFDRMFILTLANDAVSPVVELRYGSLSQSTQ